MPDITKNGNKTKCSVIAAVVPSGGEACTFVDVAKTVELDRRSLIRTISVAAALAPVLSLESAFAAQDAPIDYP